MNKVAIYPGTFDPITYGHIDVIKKALKIFDKIIVAVSEVSDKNYLFSLDERISIVNKALFSDLNLNKKKVRSHRVSRGVAVLLVYAVILFVFIGGGSYVVPKVSSEMGVMIKEFPKAVTKISKEWGPILDEKITKVTKESIEKIVNELIDKNKTNFKGVGQPLRIALTGSKFGPGIYDIILSLDKNEIIKRLKMIKQN